MEFDDELELPENKRVTNSIGNLSGITDPEFVKDYLQIHQEDDMTLAEIKKKISDFEKCQAKNRKFGAEDTEPDGIFQNLLMMALKNKNFHVPATREAWELYDKNESERVAQELHDAAYVVVLAIGEVKINESAELRKYLKEYCWRVS